jgi:hypothetical protein
MTLFAPVDAGQPGPDDADRALDVVGRGTRPRQATGEDPGCQYLVVSYLPPSRNRIDQIPG